jgi:hypothetical protein
MENTMEFFSFFFTYCPKKLRAQLGLTNLVNFFTTFIGTPNLTKNPHLRSKFVEVFSLLTPRRLKFTLMPNPFELGVASRELGGALLRFFVDFERTGGMTRREEGGGRREEVGEGRRREEKGGEGRRREEKGGEGRR